MHAADPTGKPIDLVTSALAGMKPSPAKPAIVALRTPLARAIDVGKDPSDERALVASIVRTLGSADDLRSTRAPGLVVVGLYVGRIFEQVKSRPLFVIARQLDRVDGDGATDSPRDAEDAGSAPARVPDRE